MKSIPVGELTGFTSSYQIFCDSPPSDPLLLEKGMYPPLPLLRGELVWGFRIVQDAASAGIESLRCTDIPGDNGEALILALKLENRADRYSWKEKVNILDLAGEIISPEEMKNLFPLVQSTGSFIPLTERYRNLQPFIRHLIDTEYIDIKTGEQIDDLPEESVSLFLETGVSLSFALRRQFLIYLAEIAKRDQLDGTALGNIIRHAFSEDDPLKPVYMLRFPILSGLEDRLTQYRTERLQGTGIDIRPPKNFEGDSFSVGFSWKSGKQLERVIKVLTQMRDDADELFSLLF